MKLYGLARVAAENMRFDHAGQPRHDDLAGAEPQDIPLEKIVFVQYPVVDSSEFSGKVEPNQALADQLMAMVQGDQPFLLPDGSTGNGVEAGAAPPPASNRLPSHRPQSQRRRRRSETPPPVAPPVLQGLSGQTAGDTNCARANSG